METANSFVTLLQRIEEFKKRYYINQLLKGTLIFLALLLSTYLLINTAEFFGRFSTGIRGALFFGFVALLLGGLFYWVIRPAMSLYGLRKTLSNEEAAQQIGQFFPEVGDKLVNTLQLNQLSSQQGDLLQASLQQRSQQLLINRFANAIQLQKNRRFLKYVLPPLAVIALILLLKPDFFTQSSGRLVQYNRDFVEQAPFQFVVANDKLQAFRNEDYKVDVRITGNALPETVYLVAGGTRFKLDKTTSGLYSYTFDNVQRELNFHLEAAGFRSRAYDITLIDRPAVLSFDVQLKYPAYLGKPNEQLANVGNLLIPQGTEVTWNFMADHTDSLALRFTPGNATMTSREVEINRYSLSRRITQTVNYSVDLRNNHAGNASNLQYTIQVIPDRYPQITVAKAQDTITYNMIALTGLLADDYGFTKLKLVGSVTRDGQKTSTAVVKDIPINRTSTSQNFVYAWPLDSIKLQPNDRVEYYLQVWDNDGVNGPKSSRTAQLNFIVPSTDDIQKQIEQSAQKTEQQIDQAIAKTQAIKKDLNTMENRMRTKKATDFQDKKQLADVLKKREELLQEVQKLQEQFKQTNETQQRFQQENSALREKMEQLQKMFSELMDPESKKLYEELKALLEKKQDDKASDLLDRLSRKERNMEKELDRALKLFKQMQMEQKVDKLAEDLNKQADNQDKLADENSKDKNAEEAKKEQDKAKEDFQKTKEEIEKLQKEAEKEDLNKPDAQEETQKDIDQQMEETSKSLDQKQSKQAAQKQNKAAKSMRNMSKSMSESMQSAEMQENQENMDDLRNLLENLITLSFSQERVMKDFRSMSLQDPRFVKLSQEQLKLQDDAKVIEDSLNALAGRVMQIQSFVTRELTDMKYYMDQSVQQLKERRLGQAAARQQFAMTSINNLSLMLNDVFKQMQQQMAGMSMPGSGKDGKKGKKGNQPSPGAGEMQKELNAKIQQLSKGGKGGRGLSEELSRLAAEQAAIRQMLKGMQDGNKGTEVGKEVNKQLEELMQKMDETETDLVNKRVNPTTLNRQNEIVTRLLESEKAMRQQEEDPKRQAQSAQTLLRRNPALLDSVLPQRTTQVEVLRSVTPAYNQYYKNEANRYLQRVSQ